MIPANTKFYLRVSACTGTNVIPFRAKEHPELYAEAIENLSADEDFQGTGFEIKDMDELIRIMALYQDKGVQLEIAADVETPEFKTSATLAGKRRGGRAVCGWFGFIRTELLSPMTAAERLVAVAHALQKWERNRTKGGEKP